MTSMMKLARKACGLGIVLAALSAQALAVDPVGTPELDPGSIAAAGALLSGGLLMLTDRRRRSK